MKLLPMKPQPPVTRSRIKGLAGRSSSVGRGSLLLSQEGAHGEPEDGRKQHAEGEGEGGSVAPGGADGRVGEAHGEGSAGQRQREGAKGHAGEPGEAGDDLGKERQPARCGDEPRAAALEEGVVVFQLLLASQTCGDSAAKGPAEPVTGEARDEGARRAEEAAEHGAVEVAGGGHDGCGRDGQEQIRHEQSNDGQAAPWTPSANPREDGIAREPTHEVSAPEGEWHAEERGEGDGGEEKAHGSRVDSGFRGPRHLGSDGVGIGWCIPPGAGSLTVTRDLSHSMRGA